MEKLVPDQLKELWHAVLQGRCTREEFFAREKHLLAGYRKTWAEALLLEGHGDLRESLLAELGEYIGCGDLTEIEGRCIGAVATVKGQWQATVTPGLQESIEQFYDSCQAIIYELMWWHTLCEDASPLAYVAALHFAQRTGCRRCLDFGAGVGGGGILFGRYGLEITLADISSSLLRFSQWRLARRGLPATCIDLKAGSLPGGSYDLVTGMDVFEHLVHPVHAVEEVGKALRPGGFLFARLHAEFDAQRPQHIVQDFGPTVTRLQELGFREVWRDEWLWGHQVFQKPGGPWLGERRTS